jgi:phosphate starvation-inducible protein PhoH
MLLPQMGMMTGNAMDSAMGSLLQAHSSMNMMTTNRLDVIGRNMILVNTGNINWSFMNSSMEVNIAPNPNMSHVKGDAILKLGDIAVEGEVKNLLVNEGKDNIDDKVEENKEKADEAEKKQEEQQEKIDEKRKERKEQEEIIEGQAEADKLEMNASVKGNDIDHVTEAQKQIVRIMKDNKLLNEDIKGIDIDLNF